MSDQETIWICAMRYALGRRSYVVSIVADWLTDHKDELSIHAKELMVKEIEEVDKENNIGMDMDREAWMRLKRALEIDLIIRETI